MRGFKVDERASKLLFKNGLFKDRRSKLVYDLEMAPHLLLKGEDMMNQRDRVFVRDRGRCRIKGKNCSGNASEMDHVRGGLSGRCDCEHNLQAACFPDHRGNGGKHVQVQWTRRVTSPIPDEAENAPESTLRASVEAQDERKCQ
jgi:hypothetical protein